MRKAILFVWSATAVLAVITAGCNPTPKFATEKPKPDVSFKPREVTDALHGVIAAHRAAYVEQVLQRAADSGLARSGTNWLHDPKMLPLHADLFRMASHAAQTRGAEFHYALRSLTPFNTRNLPQTDVERQGLEFVATNATQNFYSEESLGGRRYFTAVYADTARAKVCAECHASPESSPQPGRLPGAIVVRVPLEF